MCTVFIIYIQIYNTRNVLLPLSINMHSNSGRVNRPLLQNLVSKPSTKAKGVLSTKHAPVLRTNYMCRYYDDKEINKNV